MTLITVKKHCISVCSLLQITSRKMVQLKKKHA